MGPPPPPLSGFAIRPKLSGVEAAAFWAVRNPLISLAFRFASELRTSGLIQPFFDRLQLNFEFLVLDCKPTICILEQGFEVLDPLVPCQ